MSIATIRSLLTVRATTANGLPSGAQATPPGTPLTSTRVADSANWRKDIACSATAPPNDEDPDALPTDFNDDRAVTAADLSVVSADVGKIVPPALVRGDISPPSSGDNSITASDLSAISAHIGETC